MVVSLQVIAHGGANNPKDIVKAVSEGGASAIAMASVLHYDFLTKHTSQTDSQAEGNFEFLKSGKAFSKITPCSIKDVKNSLMSSSIETRI